MDKLRIFHANQIQSTLVNSTMHNSMYRIPRTEGLVQVFFPIYYCIFTTFISTMAKSIKLITCYENLVPVFNYIVFYNA